jgi:alkylation response protein AidB-like acyl-CoA dehydrogenase
MTDSLVPSSATSGFFQTFPKVQPQYTAAGRASSQDETTDDIILSRLVQQYLPAHGQSAVERSMHAMSRTVLTPRVLDHALEAETVTPYLRPITTFGEINDNDPLVTCGGWKALKAIGVQAGVVKIAYDESITSYNRRLHQFLLNHNWHHTSTLTMCPMAMTDGAASLLAKHLNSPDGDQPGRNAVLKEYYRRLTTDDPKQAWTSGQWMTERSGGSDVRGTETIATRLSDITSQQGQDVLEQPLGPWAINGFKWFSSATDSDMTMMLAQTTKGLSAFVVPMRRKTATGTKLNGIRIQRLKNKMGTKGLPTAELELKGARGWILGEEGKGVQEIVTILNITRLYTAAGSVSYWSRGLAVSRAYTIARKTRGAFLYENLQHNYWMASETVKYRGAMSLTFFGVALLGCVEQGIGVMKNTPSAALIPDIETASALLRLLTPVIKAQVSVSAVAGIRANMECLGGVGYCENHEDGGILNLAKIFRDSIVQTIWEGTVSVMADDVGRILRDKRIAKGRIVEEVFAPWVRNVLELCRGDFPIECAAIEQRLNTLLRLISRVKSNPAQLEYSGRWLLEHLQVLAAGSLLLHDAILDREEIASNVAVRYVSMKVAGKDRLQQDGTDLEAEAVIDRKIFLGPHFTPELKKAKI